MSFTLARIAAAGSACAFTVSAVVLLWTPAPFAPYGKVAAAWALLGALGAFLARVEAQRVRRARQRREDARRALNASQEEQA